MEKRISESDLILPALFYISQAGRISTTELARSLREMLKPQGEDIQILSGRLDDKFSQKVRNLRSHRTLEREGLATYNEQGTSSYWQITDIGNSFLEANQPLLEYLIEQGFDYTIQQIALAQIIKPSQGPIVEVKVFDESIAEHDVSILEGRQKTVKQKIYERSAKLRSRAIEHYTVDGKIRCQVCDFDFGSVYGSHGEGFIEIHHLKPIFSYSDEDNEMTLSEALRNVVPLCSNCHQMIHRKQDHMLTVEELQVIYQAS